MLMLCLASGLFAQSVRAVCTQPERSLESCARSAEIFSLKEHFRLLIYGCGKKANLDVDQLQKCQRNNVEEHRVLLERTHQKKPDRQ